MLTLIFGCLLFVFSYCSAGHGICYPKYGCFHNDPPYRRPLVPFPNPADLIGTKFRLYTRANRDMSTIIDDEDPNKIANSHYDASKRTILIIHGFIEHGQIPWMNRIRHALLTTSDVNVIQVDWAQGAAIPYEQATANARMVGSQVFELIKFINNQTNNTPKTFYIVAFSLGAHIGGYVGRRFNENQQKLGRITGLDPASMFFTAEHVDVRLDPSDAEFVDVIHTDMDFLGTYTQSGHIDFYPNGGEDQAGCRTDIITTGPVDYVICDHMRAPEYFTASVLTSPACPMRAFPCKSMHDFKRGYCFKCKNEECPSMGYFAEAARGHATGKHYLFTSEDMPFCVNHYHVTFKTGPGWFTGTSAAIHITLYGANGANSGVIRFKARKINSGTMEFFIAPVSKVLGTLTKIDVRHNGTPIIDRWYLEKVVVVQEGSETKYTACFDKWLNSAGGVRRLQEGDSASC